MPGPLSPSDVTKKKAASIPEVMFEVVNDLIVKTWDGHQADIALEKIVDGYLSKAFEGASRETLAAARTQLFSSGWLDFEDAYRAAGWSVRFDRPVYYGGENFAPHYTFKKRGAK